MKSKKKKKITPVEKQSTWSFFTLILPSVLISILLTFDRQIEFVIIGFILFFWQAIMLKNFIEKHYKDY